jgi:glycosyltransferase involved in cell wall biosynthesis
LGQLERGGAELRTIELAEVCQADRVQSDFVVLSGRDGVLDARVRAAGGAVIKCALSPAFPVKFCALVRRGRYDVVHSHVHYFSGVILAIARIAGVRCRIAQLHTALANDRGDTARRRAQIAACRVLMDRYATDIVAVGEGTMNGAWNRAWSADPRCRVIYNSIRPDRLSSVPDRRADEPTIVCVGSLKPLKNQLRLVGILKRVARKVPGVQLQLIGKEVGDYGDAIRQAAADAGIADLVHVIGEVDEPIEWIARAHLMVLPSLWEGLPCALLEACVTGTPAVVSDLPGTQEIARHFPDVTMLSLQEGDDIWASAMVRALQANVPRAAEAVERFDSSPFAFPRFVNAHVEIWSRSHAMA